MNNNNYLTALLAPVGTVFSYIGFSLSLTDLQAIISIISTIIGLIITVVSVLIIPVWKQINKAKEDGKLTVDELENIVDTANKGLDDIKREIDKHE